mgnify:CR=1 FL=1
MSRGNWYRLLTLALVGLMIYDQGVKKDQGNLKEVVRCLIEHKGDEVFCPQITVDPLLQQSIQRKFEQEFDQSELKQIKRTHDGKFEAHIHSSRGTGITLVAIRISKTNFQVVGWRDLELGEES